MLDKKDLIYPTRKTLKTFEYFLHCYFHMGADYSELENLVQNFKTDESEIVVKQLIGEIDLILSNNNWDSIREFVMIHGKRSPNEDKLKWMIKTIKKGLFND